MVPTCAPCASAAAGPLTTASSAAPHPPLLHAAAHSPLPRQMPSHVASYHSLPPACCLFWLTHAYIHTFLVMHARARTLQAFLLAFMKMHWALRCLAPGRSGPAVRDPRLVLRSIQVWLQQYHYQCTEDSLTAVAAAAASVSVSAAIAAAAAPPPPPHHCICLVVASAVTHRVVSTTPSALCAAVSHWHAPDCALTSAAASAAATYAGWASRRHALC